MLSALAVSQIVRDIQFVFSTLRHQLQTFGPTFDNAVERELNRLAAIVAAIENSTIDELTFIVHFHRLFCGRFRTLTCYQYFVLQTGLRGLYFFAESVSSQERFALFFRLSVAHKIECCLYVLVRFVNCLPRSHMLVQTVDLAGQVVLNQILIPLQLGRGIPAHILVVIAGHGGVEYVHGEVQYAVLRVIVVQDDLIHRPQGKGFVEVLGGGEMIGVQIAPAHHKEVRGTQHANEHGRQEFPAQDTPAIPFAEITPQQQGGRSQNEQQGGEGIGPEEGDAVGHQGIHQHILHLGIGPAGEAAEHARSYPGQQGEAAGDAQGPPEGLHEALFVIFPPHDAVQRDKAQHGQGHLQHHQRHRDRPELVVQR